MKTQVTVQEAFENGMVLQDDPVLCFPIGADEDTILHEEHIAIDIVPATGGGFIVRCCVCGGSYDMEYDAMLDIYPLHEHWVYE